MDTIELRQHVTVIEIGEETPATLIEIGQTGPTGPPGLDGGSYTHEQSTPTATWSITHNLGYKPAVSIEDVDGNSHDALVTWPTANTVVVLFAAVTAGRAHLS